MGLKGQNMNVAVVGGGVQESGKEDLSFSRTLLYSLRFSQHTNWALRRKRGTFQDVRTQTGEKG